MTRTALPQLQVGLVALLRATTAFTALLGGAGTLARLYDAVPEKPTYPFAVIDDPFEIPSRTFGQDGHEQTIVLSIYTQDGSATRAGTGAAGFRSGLLIAQEAITAVVPAGVDTTPLTVAGHDVVSADVVSVEAFREDDGITRRVDITFAVLLEDSP